MNSDDETRRTAEFVEAVAVSARSRLALFWFPMIAFGLVSVGAAIFALVFDPIFLWFYWMVVGTAAGVATAMHYRRRQLEMGLVRRAGPYLGATAFLSIGVFTAPLIVREDPAWAISIWTGLGYGLFAWLEKSSVVATVALIFVALGLVFLAIEVGNEIAWVSAVSGVVLLVGAARIYPKKVISLL